MFFKESIPFNRWNKTTIMLDKVCAYAYNYTHDEVVQQYCLIMIKFAIQITLKLNMNTRTN